jgi:hypothetical protein
VTKEETKKGEINEQNFNKGPPLVRLLGYQVGITIIEEKQGIKAGNHKSDDRRKKRVQSG